MTDDSAAACLAGIVLPKTPPGMKKYRKLSNIEPGSGNSKWNAATPIEDKSVSFGRSKPSKTDSVASAFEVPQVSHLSNYLSEKKESIYASTRREPLGKTPVINSTPPSFTQAADFKFGMPNSLIFPPRLSEVRIMLVCRDSRGFE